MNSSIVVLLECNDGVSHTIPHSEAQMSGLLRHLLEEEGPQDGEETVTIPLPNVGGSVMPHLIKYMVHHHDNRAEPIEQPITSGNLEAFKEEKLSVWDRKYITELTIFADGRRDCNLLYDVALAANFLDVRDLVYLCCATMSMHIREATKHHSASWVRANFCGEGKWLNADLVSVIADFYVKKWQDLLLLSTVDDTAWFQGCAHHKRFSCPERFSDEEEILEAELELVKERLAHYPDTQVVIVDPTNYDIDVAVTYLSELRRLKLQGRNEKTSRVDDQGLKHIAKSLPLLHKVELMCCPHVTSSGVIELGSLAGLEYLSCVGTDVITSLGFPRDTPHFPQLTSVNLGGGTNDATMEELLALQHQLTSISIVYAKVSEEGLQHLSNFHNLTELNISGGTFAEEPVSNTTLSTIFSHLPKLQKLELGLGYAQQCWFNKSSMATILGIPARLRSFSIQMYQPHSDWYDCDWSSFASLEELSFQGHYHQPLPATIIASLPQLRRLDCGWSKLSNGIVACLVASCPRLEELICPGGYSVAPEDLEPLLELTEFKKLDFNRAGKRSQFAETFNKLRSKGVDVVEDES